MPRLLELCAARLSIALLLLANLHASAYADGDIAALQAKADAGNAEAQKDLGLAYWTGSGVTKDDALAVQWFRKAAEQGLAPAQNDLGVAYATGRGVEKDEALAVQWYRKAAEQGLAKAQANLGSAYATGSGVGQDYTVAVQWFRKAAEQGLAQAQNALGAAYATGRGVEKDQAIAAQWFRRGTEQAARPAGTNPQGSGSAGASPEHPEKGSASAPLADKESAQLAANKAGADQGDARAQYNLGLAYATGRGVEKDETEAARWFRKAADQGFAQAQNALGLALVGRGDTESVQWLRKAADQGLAESQYYLGAAYTNGRGVQQDLTVGARWYRKAADQGNAEAQNDLGRAYEMGQGVQKDKAEAARWYRKAADQGLEAAVYALDALKAEQDRQQNKTTAEATNRLGIMISVFSVAKVCADHNLFEGTKVDLLKESIKQYIGDHKIDEGQVNKVWTAVQQGVMSTTVRQSDCAELGQNITAVFGPTVFNSLMEKNPF